MKIQHIGLHSHRCSREPLEAIFADAWKYANENKSGVKYGILEYLLSDDNSHPRPVTQQEATIAATVIQWLGSPVGRTFVEDCLDRL